MVPNLTEEEIQEIMELLKLKHEDVYEFSNFGRFYLDSNLFKKRILQIFRESIIDKVWKKKGDLYIINAGKEGSGKSLFSIWLAYKLSKEYNKSFDPFINIALDHDEWISAQSKLRQEVCVYDEAYQTFDNQVFNTYEGRSGKEFAIRNRFKQIINILNYPNFLTMNYYIKEHRFNLLFLNLDLELSTGKTIYVKVLYDRSNALKLIEYASKIRLIDRFDIIKGKKSQWRFFLAGIFDLTEDFKDEEMFKIFQLYNYRKELASDELSVNKVFKDFFRKKKVREIYNYSGDFPYLTYLLIRFLLVYYFKLINILDSPGYLLNLKGLQSVFFQKKNEGSKSKKKDFFNDDSNSEIEYIYIPKSLVSLFIEPTIFEDAFKDIIQQTTYRLFKKEPDFNGVYYKIKIGDFFYYLDLLKTPFKFNKDYVKLWDLIQVHYEDRNNLSKSLKDVLSNRDEYLDRVIKLKDFVKAFENFGVENKKTESALNSLKPEVKREISKYLDLLFKLKF